MGNKIVKLNRRNAGTTLVEIVVSFALLGIFMACAAMIISSVATTYFNVKGETYAKQVTDIVMEKIASTLEGAKYDKDITHDNPAVLNNNTRVRLRDRTDTKVIIYAEEGEVRFFYAQITNETESSKNREATIWRFDDAMYNGFTVEELYFVPGNEIGSFEKASEYGMSTAGASYGNDVIVILMKMSSPKYGDYYAYRVVKMYYVPDTSENGAEDPVPGT